MKRKVLSVMLASAMLATMFTDVGTAAQQTVTQQLPQETMQLQQPQRRQIQMQRRRMQRAVQFII